MPPRLYSLTCCKHNINENAKHQATCYILMTDKIMHPFAEVGLLKYMSIAAIKF